MRHRPSAFASIARPGARFVAVQALERRVLMCIDGSEHVLGTQLGTFPHVDSLHVNPNPQPTEVVEWTAGAAASASVPLSSIPALNSKPAATAKLYLDFDGDVTTNWGIFNRHHSRLRPGRRRHHLQRRRTHLDPGHLGAGRREVSRRSTSTSRPSTPVT